MASGTVPNGKADLGGGRADLGPLLAVVVMRGVTLARPGLTPISSPGPNPHRNTHNETDFVAPDLPGTLGGGEGDCGAKEWAGGSWLPPPLLGPRPSVTRTG